MVRDIGMAAMAVYVLSMMVEVGMNIGVGFMYIPTLYIRGSSPASVSHGGNIFKDANATIKYGTGYATNSANGNYTAASTNPSFRPNHYLHKPL